MVDLGLTHIALPVSDLDANLAFYQTYAEMQVVHERADPRTGTRVAWIGDGTRPFVIVLVEADQVEHPLVPLSHLGVGCDSREEIDRRAARAHGEGRPVWGPTDSGPPVGYWALIADPDHHTLELSHGQEVGLAVANAFEEATRDPAGPTGKESS